MFSGMTVKHKHHNRGLCSKMAPTEMQPSGSARKTGLALGARAHSKKDIIERPQIESRTQLRRAEIYCVIPVRIMGVTSCCGFCRDDGVCGGGAL
jgi:hypothetical protein